MDDLIKDGWFHEWGSLWPGQAMLLEVEKVLHHSNSKYQDVLVCQSVLLQSYFKHPFIRPCMPDYEMVVLSVHKGNACGCTCP